MIGGFLHPIERLRMVAGGTGDDPALIAEEAAAALVALAEQPAALLIACRRLVDRQPSCGPLWWLAARVLASSEPAAEATRAAEELEDDATPTALAAHLPQDGVITVLGWPDQAGGVLTGRLDLHALVVDTDGEGRPLVSRLERAGGEATLVAESKLAAAVVRSDLVLLEASALGPSGLCAPSGSWAAAAVARDVGRPVWVVAGTGRVLSQPLWDALADRMSDGRAWTRRDEIVPLRLVDQVVGPGGPEPADLAVARADSPPSPELCRRTERYESPGSRGPGRFS